MLQVLKLQSSGCLRSAHLQEERIIGLWFCIDRRRVEWRPQIPGNWTSRISCAKSMCRSVSCWERKMNLSSSVSWIPWRVNHGFTTTSSFNTFHSSTSMTPTIWSFSSSWTTLHQSAASSIHPLPQPLLWKCTQMHGNSGPSWGRSSEQHQFPVTVQQIFPCFSKNRAHTADISLGTWPTTLGPTDHSHRMWIFSVGHSCTPVGSRYPWTRDIIQHNIQFQGLHAFSNCHAVTFSQLANYSWMIASSVAAWE